MCKCVCVCVCVCSVPEALEVRRMSSGSCFLWGPELWRECVGLVHFRRSPWGEGDADADFSTSAGGRPSSKHTAMQTNKQTNKQTKKNMTSTSITPSAPGKTG